MTDRSTDAPRGVESAGVKVPAGLLKGSRMPQASKDFLSGVGLPAHDDSMFSFFRDARGFHYWSHGGKLYLVLAELRDQRLCVDDASGEVWVVDGRDELPPSFVNSSPQLLVAFIRSYSVARAELPEDVDDVAAVLAPLRRELAGLDPRALEDERCWWDVILAETENGML